MIFGLNKNKIQYKNTGNYWIYKYNTIVMKDIYKLNLILLLS